MKKNGKHLFIREIEYISLWIRLGRVHQNWIKHILKQCLFKQIMVSIFIQKKKKNPTKYKQGNKQQYILLQSKIMVTSGFSGLI